MLKGFPDNYSPLRHCNKAHLNHPSVNQKFTLAPLTVAKLCRGKRKKEHLNNFLKLSNIRNQLLVL